VTRTINFEHAPEDLLSSVENGVLILSINRQGSYNAWTSALRDELASKLREADNDDAIKAVVLTGTGERAFCAGQDLSELEQFTDGAAIEPWLQRMSMCYDAVREFSKPLVAAINGVAAGSGFQVTQFCDYVVAHPGVKVGQPEVTSGLPSVFGTWLMWERVGRRAIELSLQGRLLDANEAKQLGFVQEVVPQPKVLEAAVNAARRLSTQPRLAYKLSKAANRLFDQDRYLMAWKMALAAYREAFDSGAPQQVIGQFFERRRGRKGSARA
jgi:enoyl-CoA hydratase/carnithine racemase